jgi:hypothetical protein
MLRERSCVESREISQPAANLDKTVILEKFSPVLNKIICETGPRVMACPYITYVSIYISAYCM